MLRASSVGLCLPARTIYAWPCRRIYAPWQQHHYCLTAGAANSDPAARTAVSSSHKPSRDSESVGKRRVPNAKEHSNHGQSHCHGPGASETSVELTSKPVVNTGSLAVVEEMREFMLEEDIQVLSAQSSHGLKEHTSPITVPRPAFPTGRPWAKEIKRVYFSDLDRILHRIWNDGADKNPTVVQPIEGGSAEPEATFPLLHTTLRDHLITLGQTQNAAEAWNSYTILVDCITRIPAVYRHLPHIPFSHLHRLCRILASNRPKTHRQYLHLLAVVTYLKHCGGNIQQFEYNALIDHAGRGWRKTREEELMHAKRVAEELAKGKLPGLTEEAYEFQNEDYAGLTPDIYTYTTLLATAARALNAKELLNTATVMQRARLPPNRITHLALLRYFTQKQNLGGVRSTLQKMRAQNLELGLDGLNACMWAYGRNNRVDICLMIYRLLRHNVVPESYEGDGDFRVTVAHLAEEYIFVDSEMQPNEITFTMLVQMMAYLGHFQAVLDILQDFLTFENREPGAPLSGADNSQPTFYAPTLSVYRNIFLGFSRHGVPPLDNSPDNNTSWNLGNLTDIFERFMHLPSDTRISYANIDIIMKSFAVTSADNHELMRDVWVALEERFGPIDLRVKVASRLTRLKMKLFPELFESPD